LRNTILENVKAKNQNLDYYSGLLMPLFNDKGPLKETQLVLDFGVVTTANYGFH